MLITDVFETIKAAGKWFDLSKAHRGGERQTPYVARTGENNGLGAILPDQGFDAPNPGKAITIGVSTSTVFYQPVSFYTSKEIQVLRHAELSAVNGPILVTILREQMSKFQWGNGASLERLKATRIMVPVMTDADDAQRVDWAGLTRLGEELFDAAVAKSHVVRRADLGEDLLPDLNFEPMFVVDVPGRQGGLFRAHKGRRLITAHRKRGNMPFVAGSRGNNSIVDFADVPALFPAGWLTLIYNGDGGTGHAKYQPAPFSASDDVIVLEPITGEASEEALLLIVSMLTHQCVPKFGFGYKLTLHRLGRQKILVPVTTNSSGEQVVDWVGMRLYGRVLRARAERPMSAVLGAIP
ncbi:hypothetical protein E3T38_14205 [Cryobacterium sp. Hb1]|nr:hypothetical protein E3T38_14205 [Cryobacterium sp. Hb1]